MTTMFAYSIVARALVFAAWAHRKQRRKQSGLPYISHPIGVARILWWTGWREPSLLDDVNEDTDEIVAAPSWPARVVEIVDGATEAFEDASGARVPWLSRKAGLLAVCAKDRELAALKAADLCDNLLDVGRYGWGGISVGPKEYGVYARGLLRLVDGRLANALIAACWGAGVDVVPPCGCKVKS